MVSFTTAQSLPRVLTTFSAIVHSFAEYGYHEKSTKANYINGGTRDGHSCKLHSTNKSYRSFQVACKMQLINLRTNVH